MSASDIPVRMAMRHDFPAVFSAMKALAGDLGDPFNIGEDALREFLFGDAANHSFALVAGDTNPPLGCLLATPVLSTVMGHVSVYVSDLWIAKAARGQSLGRRLLAAAAREGMRRWKAGGLILNFYDDNTDASAFYRHLGFEIHRAQKRASLAGAGLEKLMTREAG